MAQEHGMDIQCQTWRSRMIFCIQASNPRFQNITNYNDECLSEAIESVFPLNTEHAILMWNHISIPLSYKYDISYMVNDILIIINAIQKQNVGKMKIHWLPDTFRSDWLIEWNNDEVQINAQWECTMGHLEFMLNQKNSIRLSKVDFVNEWKEVFGVLIRGLKHCGYDKSKIKGMEDLVEQYEKIKGSGICYKD